MVVPPTVGKCSCYRRNKEINTKMIVWPNQRGSGGNMDAAAVGQPWKVGEWNEKRPESAQTISANIRQDLHNHTEASNPQQVHRATTWKLALIETKSGDVFSCQKASADGSLER